MLEKSSIEFIFRMHCKRTPPNLCNCSYGKVCPVCLPGMESSSSQQYTQCMCVLFSHCPVTVQFRRCVHLGISKQ